MSYRERITWGRGARFWLVLLALVGIISLLALACGGGEEKKETPAPAATAAATPAGTPAATPPAGGPLKIGMLFDYTGRPGGVRAEHGDRRPAGGQADQRRRRRPGQARPAHQGRRGNKPQVGVEAATRLVNVEGVQAIVGCLSSGVTIAVAEGVAVPNKIVMISPASTSPA